MFVLLLSKRDVIQVIVIDHGRVVEQGTHSQLLGTGGVYKQLVLRQLTQHNDLAS